MTKSFADLVQEAKTRVREISAADAAKMLEQGSVIIDVREPDEYRVAHIRGAVNIPRGVLEFQVTSNPALKDHNRSIIVQCGSGTRSCLGADTLQALGFHNVVSLAGGIAAWREAGFPTEE